MMVAAAFGLSGNLEAYIIAFSLISLPVSILLNPLQSTLIPALTKAHNENNGSSTDALLRSTVTITLVGLLLFGFLAPFVPKIIHLVAHGFSDKRQAVVREYVYWLIPYYLFSALNILGLGVLQARKMFAYSAVIPAALPLAVIIFLLVFGHHQGALVLVWGLCAGAVVEYLFINIALWQKARLLVVPGWLKATHGLRAMFRQFALFLPGTFIVAFVPLINNGFASRVGHGAVAALSYGYRLPAMISTVSVTAIGIAALPFFSGLVVAREYDKLNHSLKRWSVILAVCALLSAAGFILLSRFFVSIVFERGAFGVTAAHIVTRIQDVYILELPGLLIGIIASRLLVAMGQTRTVTIVAMVSTALYVIAAYLLVPRLGVIGIALAGALVSAINAGLLFFGVRQALQAAQ
ncbi:MAG: murein biosynthesis integral membrane protein MurJ [Acidiferrobacter sp.]